MATWRPDFASLRLFVAVCEEASISAAAEREAIVPSAISKRISEIESATGATLLVRGGRGVKPTAAGEVLLHHARHILRSTDKLQAELTEYGRGIRGHVRVLANSSSIIEFLPADLARFLAVHPEVRVDLQERVSRQVVEGVAEGQAELGICMGSVEAGLLQLQPYAANTLAVICHPAHPLAQRAAVGFADIMDHDLVGLQPQGGTTTFLSGLAARQGRALNFRIYVDTYEGACHIIAENLAIGILPAEAASLPRTALGLRALPLAEDWARREISLCMRDYAALSGPARALADHLRACGQARGDAFAARHNPVAGG